MAPGDAADVTGPTVIRSCVPNGLVATMLDAYNGHVPLVLRPDDVWIAIMTAFSAVGGCSDGVARPPRAGTFPTFYLY
jgi:hypothetical protein